MSKPNRRLPTSALCFLALAVGVVACAPRHNAAPPDPPPPTQVGLDRIATGELAVPSGPLGLVVHSASITLSGEHAIDVFRRREADVVRLFSPEHGLRGLAAAGQHVASDVDSDSGLEISSLYGASRKPSQESLRGIETLVFDLQGGGVRFYTYVSTLLLCLEAAAENDVTLLVLDRPNLLGGLTIGGPASDDPDLVAQSFVNMAPGPLVHGLTLGEVARFANHERSTHGLTPARLEVVPMQHWDRSMTWQDTKRPWTNPSPNLRSPEAALLYPGMALFEGTNVSEGRGTNDVFRYFGAPWFDDNLIQSLLAVKTAGIELRETSFVPESLSVAPDPKYEGETCRGVEVVPLSAGFEPFSLGARFLAILVQHPEFRLEQEGKRLTRLIGTSALSDLLQGQDPAGAVEAWLLSLNAEHQTWRSQTRPFLLYESAALAALSSSESAM